MSFEVFSEILNVETIAVDTSIYEISRLKKIYGEGRWRKLKGIATIKLKDGFITKAELHWYECHGIGKKEMKIKRYLK